MIKFVLSPDEKDRSFPNWKQSVEMAHDVDVPRRGDEVLLDFGSCAVAYEVSNVIWAFTVADEGGMPEITVELERL